MIFINCVLFITALFVAGSWAEHFEAAGEEPQHPFQDNQFAAAAQYPPPAQYQPPAQYAPPGQFAPPSQYAPPAPSPFQTHIPSFADAQAAAYAAAAHSAAAYSAAQSASAFAAQLRQMKQF